jgi:two-component system NtrC family sensor kinase
MKQCFDLTAPLKALLVASIVLPLLVFLAVARESYLTVFRGAEARAEHVSFVVEEHAAKALEGIVLALRLTDQRLKGVDWREIESSTSVWDEVRALQGALEQADSIFVVTPTGHCVLTTRVFPCPGLDFSDRDYYRAHIDADAGVYLSDAYMGKISSWPIFNLSIRRSSPTGAFDGVVGSSVSIAYFAHFYQTIAHEEGVTMSLVRDGGEVLVQVPESDPGEQFARTMAGSQAFHDDGNGHFVIARQVGAFPLHIEYAIDKAAVFSVWYRRLAGWGALMAAVAFGLFTTSWVALRRAGAERTAREELERQIRHREETEALLRQSQKMEALGRLTGGVAHDFNNLIQIIIGGVYRLRRIGDPKSQQAIDLINHAAQRSAHLTRQLLSFSRRQKLNPIPTDIGAKLRQIVPLLERSLRPDIALTLAVADDAWPVEVDPVELEIALINVCANARDAMPSGGEFSLTIRNVRLAGHETAERLVGDFVELAANDTGTGMSREVMEHAFEPFFTTKERDRGTGLGLSQVYGFARESGGTVLLSSGEGTGTRVALILPRSARMPSAIEDKPDVTSAPRLVRRLLMVEDNVEVATTGADMLRGLGYLVDVVDSGEAALRVLAEDSRRYSLVFSDIVMPGGMNGLELRERIRGLYPHLPVVLTTGYSRDLRQGSEGDAAILRKPYEPDALRATIEATLADPRVPQFVRPASQG